MNENPFQQIKSINDYSDDSLNRNKYDNCSEVEVQNVYSDDL